MSEPTTVRALDKGLAVIVERLKNMQKDIDSKHTQNRGSIHSINGRLDKLGNDIWLLKVKIAGYASVAGVVTAILVHYVDRIFTKGT